MDRYAQIAIKELPIGVVTKTRHIDAFPERRDCGGNLLAAETKYLQEGTILSPQWAGMKFLVKTDHEFAPGELVELTPLIDPSTIRRPVSCDWIEHGVLRAVPRHGGQQPEAGMTPAHRVHWTRWETSEKLRWQQEHAD